MGASEASHQAHRVANPGDLVTHGAKGLVYRPALAVPGIPSVLLELMGRATLGQPVSPLTPTYDPGTLGSRSLLY